MQTLGKVFPTTATDLDLAKGVSRKCDQFGLVLVQTWRKVFLPAHGKIYGLLYHDVKYQGYKMPFDNNKFIFKIVIPQPGTL